MRSEKEILELLLHVAQEDKRIRAVYMNGSRTNPNVPKDIFQDYDIVYVVTETESFIKDTGWTHVFGDLLMIQEPDKNNMNASFNIDHHSSYGYLMLFTDGNRIDLRIQAKEEMLREYGTDKLTVPLLDKDHILPPIPEPIDSDYQVKMPTKEEYFSCCNNFWWCLQNVAKGIWRDELPYAKQMFEQIVRADLDQMVSWWIGRQNDFQVSPGKMGKYFNKYLPASYWALYEGTYSNSEYENFWGSIFVTCSLFRTLAMEVAEQLHFTYVSSDDQNMTNYLKHVRNLPRDAKEIY